MEQIEKLENALKETKKEDIMNLLPDDVKADIEADKAEAEKFESPRDIDFDTEVKKVLDDIEPSDEVKNVMNEFEAGKELFNEELVSSAGNPEELVKKEIKRIEELKKKVETMKKGLEGVRNSQTKDSLFTNLWNGMGYDL